MNLILIKDGKPYVYNIEDLTITELGMVFEEIARIATYSDSLIKDILLTDNFN